MWRACVRCGSPRGSSGVFARRTTRRGPRSRSCPGPRGIRSLGDPVPGVRHVHHCPHSRDSPGHVQPDHLCPQSPSGIPGRRRYLRGPLRSRAAHSGAAGATGRNTDLVDGAQHQRFLVTALASVRADSHVGQLRRAHTGDFAFPARAALRPGLAVQDGSRSSASPLADVDVESSDPGDVDGARHHRAATAASAGPVRLPGVGPPSASSATTTGGVDGDLRAPSGTVTDAPLTGWEYTREPESAVPGAAVAACVPNAPRRAVGPAKAVNTAGTASGGIVRPAGAWTAGRAPAAVARRRSGGMEADRRPEKVIFMSAQRVSGRLETGNTSVRRPERIASQSGHRAPCRGRGGGSR